MAADFHGKRRTDSSVSLSKALSWLLRHGAGKEGFTFLPGGYLYVDEILRLPRFQCYSLQDVENVVAFNDKQRFHLELDSMTKRLKIKAHHGHSIQVQDLDCEPITSSELFPIVIHGTYYKFWDNIRLQGLKRMNRIHIHFAPGLPGENEVKSGMRKSCDIIIYLDLDKALRAGLQFFHSSNNVILCPGNEDGVIDPAFFKKVLDRKTGKEIH